MDDKCIGSPIPYITFPFILDHRLGVSAISKANYLHEVCHMLLIGESSLAHSSVSTDEEMASIQAAKKELRGKIKHILMGISEDSITKQC